jgi:hypothetical protein
MKKYFIIVLVACSLLSTYTAQAQPEKGDSYMNLFYSSAMPVGNFKSSFIDRTSWRGMALEIMWYSNEKLAMGVSFGYQDFYQKTPRDLYVRSDGSDISAVRSRSLQTIPVMFKTNYFLKQMKPANNARFGASKKTESKLQALPYISLGAGLNMVAYQQLYGIFTNADDFRVGFAAQAGLGVKVPFGRFLQNGLLLESNYNLMPFNQFVMTNLNHFNFRLGFQFEVQ